MSHVDNVILSFSILEDSIESEREADRWPIMDQVNEWLREHVSGQSFKPELSSFHEAYGGRKVLETPLFVAAFNYLPEEDFLAFLKTLPWQYPEEVQFIVKRQHDELFEIVRPCLDG